jgi:hypothetical protein
VIFLTVLDGRQLQGYTDLRGNKPDTGRIALCRAYVQSIPVFSRLGCLRGTTGWPASARLPLLFERFAAALGLPNPNIPSAHKLSTNCQTSVHARRIRTATCCSPFIAYTSASPYTSGRVDWKTPRGIGNSVARTTRLCRNPLRSFRIISKSVLLFGDVSDARPWKVTAVKSHSLLR